MLFLTRNFVIEFQFFFKQLLSYAKNVFDNILTQIFLIKIFSSKVLAFKRINYFLILQQIFIFLKMHDENL